MRPVIHEVLTREEAEKRRDAILAQAGDEQKFRERGEDFDLDSEETVLYDDLREIEFLLYGP